MEFPVLATSLYEFDEFWSFFYATGDKHELSNLTLKPNFTTILLQFFFYSTRTNKTEFKFSYRFKYMLVNEHSKNK
jgi:hypothetical protein